MPAATLAGLTEDSIERVTEMSTSSVALIDASGVRWPWVVVLEDEKGRWVHRDGSRRDVVRGG